MPRDEFLLITDRYPHKINVKGGWRNWKPRKIYITTNYNGWPGGGNWFKDEAAVWRRITEFCDMWGNEEAQAPGFTLLPHTEN